MNGGTIFFVILQIFANSTSILMLLNTPDRYDAPIISLVGLGMIVWSLSLFQGLSTVWFVIGLTSLGVGFALDTGTTKRNTCLAIGSALIALFSYLSADWIFFWLNAFFAVFSGYYAVQLKQMNHN